MNDSIIADYCEKLLEAEEDFFVPIKKIFLVFKKSQKFKDLTYHELSEAIASDQRFSLYTGSGQFEQFSKLQQQKLAKLGYFDGPKVILKKRRPKEEKILIDFTRAVDRVERSLKNISVKKPKDAEQVTETVNTALKKIAEIKTDVQKTYIERKSFTINEDY